MSHAAPGPGWQMHRDLAGCSKRWCDVHRQEEAKSNAGNRKIKRVLRLTISSV